MSSLRGRLTLGVTLVLAVVLAASGTLVARYVRDADRGALDDRLVRTAELSRATAVAAVESALPSADDRLDAVLSATGTSLRLFLGRTLLLATGSRSPAGRAPRLGLQTYEVGGARYRSDVISLRSTALGGLARLEVTAPLDPLERRQAARERRLVAVGLAALAIAGLGTWLAAGAVLRPLRRLREVTASIAADEDLSRTAPPDGPREVRAVATSFNAMLARLARSAADRERALAATRRFAADVGHELRTPLTAVQATLSALARHPHLDPARRTAMASDALDQQRRLVDLLGGLQALARGDAAPGGDEDVDLAEVVAEAVAEVRGRHPGVDVGAELPEEPVLVRGWEPGLRILVGNLVGNAADHGGAGRRDARVRVTLSPGARPALLVDDDGPGVPEPERERVFEPFTRLADGDGAVPGSGLGLALAAQQARHHGARLTIEDSPLGGARFAVRFGAGEDEVA